MTLSDVIVIGGGIHGGSAAFHLAKRGVRVSLVEKDTMGRHASGVNAGGVRQIFRALPEIPLSVVAMDFWERIEEILGDDCGFQSLGHIFVAENDEEMSRLVARRQETLAAGFGHEELVDARRMRELAPALADHCVGGLVSRRDGAALPMRTVLAFRREMLRLGVSLRENTRVLGLERKAGTWTVRLSDGDTLSAPNLVNASGAWGAEIAGRVGDMVEMQAVAPMLMISARHSPEVSPVVSVVSEPLSFKQFANGTVLIGGGYEGGADLANGRTHLDFRLLAKNLRTAARIFPFMNKTRIVRAWAGIEGRTSDGLPVIGPSVRGEGMFHSFGFSAHGFQLGPIVGRITADLITEGRTDLPIAAFSVERFTAGRLAPLQMAASA